MEYIVDTIFYGIINRQGVKSPSVIVAFKAIMMDSFLIIVSEFKDLITIQTEKGEK